MKKIEDRNSETNMKKEPIKETNRSLLNNNELRIFSSYYLAFV